MSVAIVAWANLSQLGTCGSFFVFLNATLCSTLTLFQHKSANRVTDSVVCQIQGVLMCFTAEFLSIMTCLLSTATKLTEN